MDVLAAPSGGPFMLPPSLLLVFLAIWALYSALLVRTFRRERDSFKFERDLGDMRKRLTDQARTIARLRSLLVAVILFWPVVYVALLLASSR